jgi:hypothetical protein
VFLIYNYDRAFIALRLFVFINLIKKKIPLIDDIPDELLCTSCLLPMQYQKKTNNAYLWQCFKCGKKYFVSDSFTDYNVSETWSSSK